MWPCWVAGTGDGHNSPGDRVAMSEQGSEEWQDTGLWNEVLSPVWKKTQRLECKEVSAHSSSWWELDPQLLTKSRSSKLGPTPGLKRGQVSVIQPSPTRPFWPLCGVSISCVSWKYLKPNNNVMPKLCAVMTLKCGIFFPHSKEINKAGWFGARHAAFFLANCRNEELGPDNVLLSAIFSLTPPIAMGFPTLSRGQFFRKPRGTRGGRQLWQQLPQRSPWGHWNTACPCRPPELLTTSGTREGPANACHTSEGTRSHRDPRGHPTSTGLVAFPWGSFHDFPLFSQLRRKTLWRLSHLAFSSQNS